MRNLLTGLLVLLLAGCTNRPPAVATAGLAQHQQAQRVSPAMPKKKNPNRHQLSGIDKKRRHLEARLQQCEKELMAMPQPPACGNHIGDALRVIESIDVKIQSGGDPATIAPLQADRDRITKALEKEREE